MPLSAQQLAAQKNLSYVLAEKLAQRILKGEYEPGTILPGEIELGEQFGVSRYSGTRSGQNVNGKRDGFTATANWYPGHATIKLEFS
ncbi:GntR family transcriptional regulator [Escherichia coli]|uniref:GntR family transcriptional regulator n=1 Tax=Escherichia coli TaxID=562 RepID=A0A376L686_ECOLX|nr:GntR family transcriptional regulator [Escherichia coli]